MTNLEDTLITRDNKGKIRKVHMSCKWSDSLSAYVIERESGLIDGKQTKAPIIEINKGKVKRTIHQQSELQYNSELKKYLDKGYKNIKDLGITELTEKAANEALPKTNTDQNDVKKPMLCKVLDESNTKLTEKDWYGSYKCDGVRMMMFLRDGEIHTASRGGGDYDIPATYIREDPYIVKLLTENEGLILDGELYAHGTPLSVLSGLARKETLEEEHKKFRYHCYDIVDEETPFKDRVARLNKFRENCPQDSKLTVLEQRLIHGLKEIQEMHDEAIENDYEGLVIKDPDKPYKCGARDTRCNKVKRFTDGEFQILGIVDGLRDEDMCFLMQTEDGTQFKAKPTGDREQKQWYREHVDELIGKMGTIKYFGFTQTEHPVPNLPVFKSVRIEKDL